MDAKEAGDLCYQVIDQVSDAVITDDRFLKTVLSGVVSQGHVLIEDVPGTGKTLTARTLADTLDLSFSRIQFTPDLLPTDVTGTHIFNEQTGDFEFNEGPIFANMVLADEINRAPPKTQAALLEAMGEGQVTVDGERFALPDPFFVIATQNPVEQEGTFPLPEAQLDRFIIQTEMGYPDTEGQIELLDRRENRMTKSPTVESVLDQEAVLDLQRVPEHVEVTDELKEYMVRLCEQTRDHESTRLGVSPRGVQRLYEVARSWAVIEGRDFVTPDDVQRIAPSVLTHRLVLTTEATVNGGTKAAVVDSALADVAVPGNDAANASHGD